MVLVQIVSQNMVRTEEGKVGIFLREKNLICVVTRSNQVTEIDPYLRTYLVTLK